MRRFVICLVALIAAAGTGVASSAARITVFAPETSTVEVRFTAPDGNDVEKRVDALFSKWDKPDSPGCALGVIKDGKLIYSRGYGKANLEHTIPIAGTTVFDIGSTSKQFTAASIVLLSQHGKLSLEDDVRKLIPELPDYGKKITIRNLLNHTSGIRDYLGLMGLTGVNFDDTTGDDDALRIIVRQKALNFDPGSEFLYSNSGYFLLSVIVKRASGKTLRQFAEENIFAPLGMKNTHFHDDHTMIVQGRATGYSPAPGGKFRIDMSNFEQTGDGAVYTTVEDLLLWDRNFYDPKVGGHQMYDQLLTQGVLTTGKKLDYACGLMVSEHKGLKVIYHGGSWAGYRAELIRFPEQRLSVVCLANLGSINPSRLARQVAEIYLADSIKTPAAAATASDKPAPTGSVTLTEKELKDLAGPYRNAKSGLVIKVSPAADRLAIDYGGFLRFKAVPVTGTRFQSVDAPVEIKLDFEGQQGSRKLIVNIEAQDPMTLDSFEVVTPTPEQLNQYAGDYYSEELDVTYTITASVKGLSVRIGGRGETTNLEPSINDVFRSQGSEYVFKRGSNSRVEGFNLNAGRVTGIKFVRK
jgi:CubicO group peptidase (beta-lactamase class C family)